MNDRRSEFLDAYRQHRITAQKEYYARRAAHSATARRWAVTVSAALLVLAALFGALATGDVQRRALWAFVAAVMSGLATALTTYEAASGFDRLARQYAETRMALTLVDTFGPQPEDLEQLASDTARDRAVARFVTRTERLLRSEVDTWSQQVVAQPRRTSTDGHG